MPWHLLEVTLQGKTFTLRTETDPEQFLKAVADAENRLKALEAQLPGLSPHKAALLALLQSSEDCLAARRALGEYRDSVRQRARMILDAVGRAGIVKEGAALPGEG
ncbi:MAG TPA: cell division protein ZapA [Myxococcota bacterium]|nr:cell division protein ZapA [Myxococcota bacterium]HQK50707.1 cell division protein ZapA [Myxococcota bacterium]